MPRTIRFHLDEHCDPAIAAGLRLHGVDVTTTPEAHLLGALCCFRNVPFIDCSSSTISVLTQCVKDCIKASFG